MASYRKSKSEYFSHILYLINLYDRYKRGDTLVTVKMMREAASKFEVGQLNLNNAGTDEEFIESMEKSYEAAREIK